MSFSLGIAIEELPQKGHSHEEVLSRLGLSDAQSVHRHRSRRRETVIDGGPCHASFDHPIARWEKR